MAPPIITKSMDEAFSQLGNEPRGNAPGPFTPQMLLDIMSDGLRSEYAANIDPDYDHEAFVAFCGRAGATFWPVGSFMNSDAAKDEMIAMIREITQAYPDIEAVAITSGAWVVKRSPEEVFADDRLPPSQSPDRREIVFIRMETRAGLETWNVFDLLRLDTGNNLVLSQDHPPESIGGRLTNYFNKQEQHRGAH